MTKKILIYGSLLLNIALAVIIYINKTPSRVTEGKEKRIIEGVEVPKKVNIVMLGNSITHAGNWSEVLHRNDILNGGKSGWTTQQLSWVIKDFIIPTNPKLCFFKGGINDYTLGISTQRIYENICINLDSIKAVGTQPVYQTTLYQEGNYQINREIDTLNTRLKQFCKEKGYDYVNLHEYLCKDGDVISKYFLEDGTHLKPEAYNEWAKAITPVLKKYGL